MVAGSRRWSHIVTALCLKLRASSFMLYSFDFFIRFLRVDAMSFLFFCEYDMGIVIGILMFMGLVLIHELGHFIAAKKSGVKVLEFGIGIPPKVCRLRTDKSGTQYTLNLLPLGGFVRLKGEDPKDTEDFHAPDSFIKAKLWRKVIVLIAGVSMNLLFAWIAFTVVFTKGTQPLSILPENAMRAQSHSYLLPSMSFLQDKWLISGNISAVAPKIEEVLSGWLASQAGLQSGDTLLRFNNQKIDVLNVSTVLQSTIGKELTIIYMRGKSSRTTTLHCPDDDCVLGISFALSGDFSIKPIQFPLVQSMGMAIREIGAEIDLTFSSLGSLGKNLLSFDKSKIKWSLGKLTGPVGAVKFGEMLLAEGGWALFLAFAGIISLALAIFNVLPLPALDGGRLLGVLIQWLCKLKPEKYFTIEGYLNLIFFVLLMGLWVYVILSDLVRFWWVHIPFVG